MSSRSYPIRPFIQRTAGHEGAHEELACNISNHQAHNFMFVFDHLYWSQEDATSNVERFLRLISMLFLFSLFLGTIPQANSRRPEEVWCLWQGDHFFVVVDVLILVILISSPLPLITLWRCLNVQDSSKILPFTLFKLSVSQARTGGILKEDLKVVFGDVFPNFNKYVWAVSFKQNDKEPRARSLDTGKPTPELKKHAFPLKVLCHSGIDLICVWGNLHPTATLTRQCYLWRESTAHPVSLTSSLCVQ